jgi:adenosylcobinamide kinase/adenosylcobinamide-phosphate guanylyltransferase
VPGNTVPGNKVPGNTVPGNTVSTNTLPGYSLTVRMDGRLAVVVGGATAAASRLAAREAAALRAAGAAVLVVAAEPGAPVEAQAARGEVAVRRGRYQATDLAGAWLVVACADRPEVNAGVAADAERLRLWCVTPGEAGSDPSPGAGQPPGVGRQNRVLVLGGARSGKSTTAESFLAAWDEVEYVATGMPPGDDDKEWAARVAVHRGRRPPRWRTTETIDLERVLGAAERAPVLVDCLSLWLARVMDECGAWDARVTDGPGEGDGPGAYGHSAVTARVERLLGAWRATARPAVVVSNEVGCGVVPATASGRLYRDALGRLNAQVAAVSDEVWLCTAGLPRRLR